jgi:flagellar hook-associated protein 2
MASTNSVSGGIHFTGLGSGMDFDEIISKTLEAESRKMEYQKVLKESWQAKIDAFQDVNTTMLDLKTTLQGMDTMGEFLIKKTAVDDSSVLSAQASADAEEGTHTIQVDQVAQVDAEVTNAGEADLTSDITGGSDETFVYTYGTDTVSLNVTAGTSLQGFISQINSDPSNPGVRASYIKVADNDYRLQLRGLDTGDANEVAVASGGGGNTLTNYLNTDFTETQDAQDAWIKVDGFPSGAGNYIVRESNTIADVIEGLTLYLKDTGTTNVTVNTDTEEIKESIRTFVEKVNEVRQIIKDLEQFDEDTERGSLLTGNYGLQHVDQSLKNITAEKALGFDWDDDTYSVLAQVGIKTIADTGDPEYGLLTIDETELDEALTNDPDSVALMFSAVDEGHTTSNAFLYDSRLSSTTEPGIYENFSYQFTAGSLSNTQINGEAVTMSYDSVTGLITVTDSDHPAYGLAVKTTTTADGTYTGDVYVKYGKVNELKDEISQLTSTTDGTLSIIEDNYYDIIEGIDKKILYEEERLDRMETRLRNRYARLEVTLANYNSTMQSLQNQMAQLSSGS